MSPGRSGMQGHWDRLVVLGAGLAFFALLRTLRMVDDDEGFYALAGRALLLGKVPYRDFFFPQAPISAVVYGAWQGIFGLGIVPLRGLSALLATATLLLVQHAARRAAGRGAGLAAAALCASHSLVWEWAPTVKTHALGMALAAAAMAVATSPLLDRRRATWAGVLVGAGLGTRLLSAPLLLVVPFICLSRQRAGASRRSRGLGFATGLGLALGPVVAFALVDPGALWFDNVGYHALRSPGEGLVKDLAQKLETARAVFLTPWGASRPDATGLQTTALVVAAALGAWRVPGVRPFFAAAFFLGLAAFLPSPSWVQYFSALVPPAAVVVGVSLVAPARPRWVAGVAVALHVAVALPAFMDRIVRQPAALRPDAVDGVGQALDRVTGPGAVVAAHWPSYLAASRREALPGTDNQFARLFSDRVSGADRLRYHLSTESDLREALLAGRAQAFVVGAFTVPETALALQAAGWQRALALDGASIWVPPGGAP